MNANNMIDKIKNVLNLSEEVKLAQMKLKNGTVLEAEAFEAEQSVFIVTEDEKVALPVGEYELEDDKILVIVEEGVIAEIKEAEEAEVSEEEKPEEPAEEVEMQSEGYATKEELAEVKSMIEEIKAMLEPKEEMAEELKEDSKEDSKEELSAIPNEVKDALSEPAAEPIVSNPEANVSKPKFNFAQNRATTTLDRVLQKLNQ